MRVRVVVCCEELCAQSCAGLIELKLPGTCGQVLMYRTFNLLYICVMSTMTPLLALPSDRWYQMFKQGISLFLKDIHTTSAHFSLFGDGDRDILQDGYQRG
jgi:hypothetical protein